MASAHAKQADLLKHRAGEVRAFARCKVVAWWLRLRNVDRHRLTQVRELALGTVGTPPAYRRSVRAKRGRPPPGTFARMIFLSPRIAILVALALFGGQMREHELAQPSL